MNIHPGIKRISDKLENKERRFVMTAKKDKLQKEFTRFLDQAKGRFKTLGKEFGVLAKKSEEKIVKVSKAGKIQLDIMGLNMQKEKLYYDVGKKVASLNTKKNLGIPQLETYWKKMHKIETNARKKKRELSSVRKEKK